MYPCRCSLNAVVQDGRQRTFSGAANRAGDVFGDRLPRRRPPIPPLYELRQASPISLPPPNDADNPLRVAFGPAGPMTKTSRILALRSQVGDGFGSTERGHVIREPGAPPGSIGRELVAVYNA